MQGPCLWHELADAWPLTVPLSAVPTGPPPPLRYECPVYLTRSRGATFVTLATLRSLDVTEKWVLAGVAIILQKDV